MTDRVAPDAAVLSDWPRFILGVLSVLGVLGEHCSPKPDIDCPATSLQTSTMLRPCCHSAKALGAHCAITTGCTVPASQSWNRHQRASARTPLPQLRLQGDAGGTGFCLEARSRKAAPTGRKRQRAAVPSHMRSLGFRVNPNHPVFRCLRWTVQTHLEEIPAGVAARSPAEPSLLGRHVPAYQTV